MIMADMTYGGATGPFRKSQTFKTKSVETVQPLVGSEKCKTGCNLTDGIYAHIFILRINLQLFEQGILGRAIRREQKKKKQ